MRALERSSFTMESKPAVQPPEALYESYGQTLHLMVGRRARRGQRSDL